MNCTERTIRSLNSGLEPPPDCKVIEYLGSYFVGQDEIVCSLSRCFALPRVARVEIGNDTLLSWGVLVLVIVLVWLGGLSLIGLFCKGRKKR